MDDILAYLENLTQPDTMPPEYFDILKGTDPFTEVIQKRLSLQFLDGLTDAQNEVARWERREAFARGVRLGVGLMLAAGPASRDTHHRS